MSDLALPMCCILSECLAVRDPGYAFCPAHRAEGERLFLEEKMRQPFGARFAAALTPTPDAPAYRCEAGCGREAREGARYCGEGDCRCNVDGNLPCAVRGCERFSFGAWFCSEHERQRFRERNPDPFAWLAPRPREEGGPRCGDSGCEICPDVAPPPPLPLPLALTRSGLPAGEDAARVEEALVGAGVPTREEGETIGSDPRSRSDGLVPGLLVMARLAAAATLPLSWTEAAAEMTPISVGISDPIPGASFTVPGATYARPVRSVSSEATFEHREPGWAALDVESRALLAEARAGVSPALLEYREAFTEAQQLLDDHHRSAHRATLGPVAGALWPVGERGETP